MLKGYEEQYLNICEDIITRGEYVEDRTGTGCYSTFGQMMKIDLSKGFPLLTTKKMYPNNIFGELLWFLSGKTDLPSLRKYQNKEVDAHTIWSDDFNKYWVNLEMLFGKGSYCAEDKDFQSGGRIYSSQWRGFPSLNEVGVYRDHDQITTLIGNIKAVKEDDKHPMARRLIVSAWNPYDHTVGDKVVCALPACHTDFQCIVRDGKLSIRYHCRSNDWFLGQPYNTASYALLCHILAKLTGLGVGELLYFGTDVHLYSNHLNQINTQLSRKPRGLPKLVMPAFETLEELLILTGKDFVIDDYNPLGFIKAPQAS